MFTILKQKFHIVYFLAIYKLVLITLSVILGATLGVNLGATLGVNLGAISHKINTICTVKRFGTIKC